MSEFVVHTIPGSPFARAVFATLEEKSAPYRIAPVAPRLPQIAGTSGAASVRPRAGA
jgi:glutathione S-transferase